MWYRINSVFLPDADYSDYLIEQYQDIQDVCQMSMPDSVVRALPNYPAAPSPTYLPPGTDPAANDTTPEPTGSATCSGQTLSPGTSGAGSCDGLSQAHGVTTGDLQAVTGNTDCSFTDSICVPDACTLQQVTGSASW